MEKKIYYLTAEGYKKYKEEYERVKGALSENKSKMKEMRDELWRPEDLNPDYEPMESELISLEIKLKELENILKNSKIIKRKKEKEPKRVAIGTKVLVKINNQTTEEFTIVDSLESNPFLGKISTESPVGKSLLDRSKGDVVVVESLTKTTYKILKITYAE